MLRRLRDGDAVSVITYNTKTQMRVPVTTIDSSSRERVIRPAQVTVYVPADTHNESTSS